MILAFVFGVVFVITLLVLAVSFPYPAPFQYLIFRVVLALAAAGVAAVLPGTLGIEIHKIVTGAGALGVFVLVFFFNPAGLLSSPVDPKELVTVGKQLANSVTITNPQPHDVITTEPYEGMSGTLPSKVPDGFKLWVLAQDRYNYFLMYPPTRSMAVQESWEQSNIRLSTPGTWRLNLAVANAKGSDWFERRKQQNDWSGFPSLPDGVEIIKSVYVKRR
jgi:hypothetical protein